ncbi:MAG TPA: PDZ domain-containing protein [Anaerolineae bacterium]|nr:PDZ domain-containing protein [Anaerolineae bacterium]
MSSKLKKWYVILGLTLGGLAACLLLLMAGGLAGGLAGYVAAHRGGVIGLPGPWQGLRPQITQPEETPKTSPQVPQPWQMPPEMMLEPSSGQLRGAVVVEVDSGGPADQAGMETGDIIIAVNNKAMDEDRDLAALIGSHKPGDEVVVTIVRPGDDTELMNLEVTLGSDTNEEGDEVAHLGLQYRSVSSGMGLMPLGRGWRSGGGAQTY